MKKTLLVVLSFLAPFTAAFAQVSSSETREKKTILYDDFSNNSNKWFLSENDQHAITLDQGKYRLNSKKGGNWFSTIPIDLNKAEDFEISVQANKISGTDGYYFGVITGYDIPLRYFHFFGITGSGEACLMKMAPERRDLIQQKKYASVNRGNSSNVLLLKRNNGSFKFYVNDVLIGDCPAEELYGNRFGFQVWSGNNNIIVDFDDLVIQKYQDKQQELTVKHNVNTKTIPGNGITESEESGEIFASNVDFKSPGKYYAIIIGASNYLDPNIPDLDSLPIKDAIALSKTLNKRYLFEKENIKELYNPTRREIVMAFGDMAKKITPNDNLLIFYAGHGHYEQENDIGYWFPTDAEVSNASNWLYNDQLVADIKKIKSLHTLLISDACFSGSIFKTRSVNMQDASSFVRQKYQLPSRKAITSGTLKTVPNKSVFIKYLLDRLNNNNEKFFSASQLFQSLEQPVSNNSKSLPQFGVIQNVGDEGGDFIFIKR